MGRLRAYGNAVDAEATRDFIAAFLEAEELAPANDNGIADKLAA
ncbi:hypothetical protein [Consotaella salsifontis]|nr:hypothetical protein [Consotaella salsifontis]